MKVVIHDEGPGAVCLNYMWLPTWIGMNVRLGRELEAALAPKLSGRELNEQTLDEASVLVVRELEARFPRVQGLSAYLGALRHVSAEDDAVRNNADDQISRA